VNTRALALSGMPRTPDHAADICARTLARHSKSFALAGKLLPEQQRRDAAVLYTYCRLVDDDIDLREPESQPAALAELQRVLDSVYRGEEQRDLRLAAFQELVQRRSLPRQYPEQLLSGMRMDVQGARYQTLDELLLYCHRVAGIVGLMMCHVLGLSDPRALRNAAHLGIAMQLTNICRDVAEDFQRGRLYLPRELLGERGAQALSELSLGSLPDAARGAIAEATQRLLREADRFYRSGDGGLLALPFRAAFSVRAARLIYSAIGKSIQRPGYDPYSMRAVVPSARKRRLLLQAFLRSLWELPRRLLRARGQAPLEAVLRFPDDILPI
jgi:phytoene synthase